ncbi:hypothetical protein J6TS2_31690 [Heyndrickxia sporothermodurans]|nr:hypothetical protein J6TS2_31690 [Heyndrickxia sporothermodurans]
MQEIHTLDMSRQNCLKELSKGIGGSDAGIILGLTNTVQLSNYGLRKQAKLNLSKMIAKRFIGEMKWKIWFEEFEKRTDKKRTTQQFHV